MYYIPGGSIIGRRSLQDPYVSWFMTAASYLAIAFVWCQSRTAVCKSPESQSAGSNPSMLPQFVHGAAYRFLVRYLKVHCGMHAFKHLKHFHPFSGDERCCRRIFAEGMRHVTLDLWKESVREALPIFIAATLLLPAIAFFFLRDKGLPLPALILALISATSIVPLLSQLIIFKSMRE